jgi:hypothetical protein
MSRIVARCTPPCEVRLEGDIDARSREFIHRFVLPPGAASGAGPRTEVGDVHLATLSPDSKNWLVPCPLCGRPISFDPEKGAGA